MKTTIRTNSVSSSSCGKSHRRSQAQWRNFRVCLLLLGIIIGVAVLSGEGRAAPAAFRADRILIKPKEGIPPGLLTNLHARLGNRELRRFPKIGDCRVLQ